MDRSTVDKLISWTGLVVATLLLAAGGGLLWAHNFIHTQVHDQLAEQRITFPQAGSKQIAALPEEDQSKVSQYAGQQLLTGAQAEVFADHYIAVHLEKAGGGKTYAELSAASLANPTDTKLAAQAQTAFKGETLRGLLLNAYAFDTMALVAQYAGLGALAGSAVLFVLAALGFMHAGKAQRTGTKSSAKNRRR